MGPTGGHRGGAAALQKRWRRRRKRNGPEVLHRYRLATAVEQAGPPAPERWPGAELRELDADLLQQFATTCPLELTATPGQPVAMTMISRPDTASRAAFTVSDARRTHTLLPLPLLHRKLSWPSRGGL